MSNWPSWNRSTKEWLDGSPQANSTIKDSELAKQEQFDKRVACQLEQTGKRVI